MVYLLFHDYRDLNVPNNRVNDNVMTDTARSVYAVVLPPRAVKNRPLSSTTARGFCGEFQRLRRNQISKRRSRVCSTMEACDWRWVNVGGIFDSKFVEVLFRVICEKSVSVCPSV